MQEDKSRLEPRGHMAESERLFLALADYLRTPLFNIARTAELDKIANQNQSQKMLSQISLTAASALSLVDSYVLSEQARAGQISLSLEPIVVSSVLYDAAQELGTLAKTHSCELRVVSPAKGAPVMANRSALKAALLSLGQFFIESTTDQAKKSLLSLSAYKVGSGVAAGVFGEGIKISRSSFERSLKLGGRARMPLNSFAGGSGAGVFIAESLFYAMSARLRVAKHDKLNGLAATLTGSRQLSLI